MTVWFDQLGTCEGPLCTRAAKGILRAESGDHIAKLCHTCGQAAIKHDRMLEQEGSHTAPWWKRRTLP